MASHGATESVLGTKRPHAAPGLIVHEWVEPTGGSERVLDQLSATFPEADIFALWNDDESRSSDRLRESWIARTPLRRHKALALPFQLATWRHIPAEKAYEWVLASSHAFAHHARISHSHSARKFVYAHTPARYVWEPDLDIRGSSAAARFASKAIQPIDRARAQEAWSIATNSEFTRERAKRAWHRESHVIYPPVDVDRIIGRRWAASVGGAEADTLANVGTGFILGASRFVPYKRLDLVIEAGEACDRPVVLAGRGPLRPHLGRLAAAARVPVHIVDSPSDELLYALYQAAGVFFFPAVEDFGIMPVEAMAAGTPVVTGPAGGAKEGVLAADGGLVAASLEMSDLRNAIEAALSLDRSQIAARTQRFSNAAFRARVSDWVGDGLSND